MSITDDVRPADSRQGEPRTPAERPADGGFDRTPPQDVAAEQCVLGGMMLSKDAIADVVEILKPTDFYRPAHATIMDAVLDLYGRGEPADVITVAAAMADAGTLPKVGGAGYLHTLIASVPTAANSAYYARIVSERAILRRLIEAGTRIVQLGFGSGGGGRDLDEVVDQAQQAVYEVTERRVGEDFAVLSDLLQPTLDEIEAVGAQGGVMTGVPTGFSDLDRLLNGLHPGQLVIVAGRPGLGKALALDTPLPTPDGWTTMGRVRPGDALLGADGRPTRVVMVTEVMHDRPCFEVEFCDGSVIVADGEHRWWVRTRSGDPQPATAREPAGIDSASGVMTTAELARSVGARRPGGGRAEHAIVTCLPLDLPERPLPVPPYLLGAHLGRALPDPDGRADPELVMYAEAEGYAGPEPEGGRIPPGYLRASPAQRRALLAGLLDAAGTVTPDGDVRYRAASPGLAADVRDLVSGLGFRCVPGGGHSVVFTADDDVFRVAYKRLVHKQHRRPDPGQRRIVDVRPVPSVPVRCVQVDNADHLYLAGRTMIPTHNSTAAMDFSRTASVKHNLASAIFSLEMSKVEIVMRLLSAEARVPLHVLRSGQLSDDDWTKLARRMGEISEAPLFVDDTPNMTLMEIRAKARRLKQRHDLKLVVVDYLQLMSSPKRTESRQQEVAELSRGLKLLAKEIECPVVAVSQLNRGPEQRTDKRPQLSDLRESGCLTAETRLLRADTNQEITLGELLGTGARDVPVWALDESLRYVPRTLTHAFPSGRRMVYRLRLASGREITATASHRFLTVDGWCPLGELRIGGRIGVPRHVPAPLAAAGRPDEQVLMLAHNVRSRVPEAVATLPKRQVAVFLRHLWAAGGLVTLDAPGRGGRIRYPSSSRRLAEDVAMLLLRFGISTVVRRVGPDGYVLDVPGRDEQLRFLREIGAPGPGGRLLAALEAAEGNPSVDTVPAEVWHRMRAILMEPSGDDRAFAGAGVRPAPGRQPLARIADVLDSGQLDLYATNDILWDPVAAVEPLGERAVYDATVLGLHNFVANGIAAHNSIEQDADVVILLHRDDYYDKESPRAGEADFIVAKHRNGPTDTVTVAAQLHLSRFVDMAIV